MFEGIIYAINGVHCVYQLRSVLDMSDLQLKACLAFLHEVGAVSFIDTFDICNIYVLENFEALWDESLLTELVEYSLFFMETSVWLRLCNTSSSLDLRTFWIFIVSLYSVVFIKFYGESMYTQLSLATVLLSSLFSEILFLFTTTQASLLLKNQLECQWIL